MFFFNLLYLKLGFLYFIAEIKELFNWDALDLSFI